MPGQHVVIIGGGASGLLAAIICARQGIRTTILEKNKRVGRKLLATGNGRCNLTNCQLDVKNYHSEQPDFVKPALQSFDTQATLEFFKQLGVEPLMEEKTGRVYPLSLQASSVVDVLRYEVERLGVLVMLETKVQHIKRNQQGRFELKCNRNRKFIADQVLVATGGKAAPSFGSTGDGYALAASLGHTIVKPFPALVQLKLASPYLKRLSGKKVVGVVSIWVNQQLRGQADGDILFTNYGISGPPILDLSRIAGEALCSGKQVVIKVNLLPQFTAEQLFPYLKQRFKQQADKDLVMSLVGLIHKQFIPVIFYEAGITELSQYASQLTEADIKAIAVQLHNWCLPVNGTMPWANAQTTAGGVAVNEIDPQTMGSRLVPGLYFAGEVMDVDGDCGGYNLQWAWASAYVAAQHICQQ